MIMAEDGKAIIRIVVIALFALLIACYALFQARNLILGPQVSITAPAPGETIDSPLVTITGTAKNITYISLNDRQIFVDEKGDFSESLLASPGYNTWELEAKDKFGRIVSKKVEVVFNNT
jgi:hypothetical protein